MNGSIEALKVMCNHADIEFLKEFKLLKENNNKFDEQLKILNDTLFNILWVSRRPTDRNEYDHCYGECNHITADEKEELWKKCVTTRDKYKILFEQITHAEDVNDEGFDDFIDIIYKKGCFDGVIGATRAISNIREDIFTIKTCICCENEDVEDITNCICKEGICDECSCNNCNQCVYTKCKCDHVIEDEINDLLQLNLLLDS